MNRKSTDVPRSSIGWRVFPALTVIAVGVLFLLGNLGFDLDFPYHGNWWAWFILLAALEPLQRAFEIYRTRGRLDAEAVRHLTGAAFIVLVAVMFLQGLDWETWWPLFVILGGVCMLVRRPYRNRRRNACWPGNDTTAAPNR
jgi:LiaF transmembrane domain